MQKQELIQLHALVVSVRHHVEEQHEFPPGVFEAYEDCPVSPTSIHRRMDAHKEALSPLLDGLEAITGGVPQNPE